MVLARCFDAYPSDAEGALSRYEDLRRDRTARAIRGSNENADRFHNSQLGDPAVAQKYVDAVKEMATTQNEKIIFLPLEASALIGSLGGIGELAKSAFPHKGGAD